MQRRQFVCLSVWMQHIKIKIIFLEIWEKKLEIYYANLVQALSFLGKVHVDL